MDLPGVTPATSTTMRAPDHCAACKTEIDWTGLDKRRAPGLAEDGAVVCRPCAADYDRVYEDYTSR